ncbi:MAG: hypothetical protein BMS9Abin05_0479 [Rhodothermia bacterium]|nr:MAG: hypothetical protein BMS9Abin05_0479 [Rhodothermia bacterium]
MVGNKLSHYTITAELGRGGMGIVYKATDTKLNRDVALKVLPAAALASEDDRVRFFREAQAAAQLHHPNIATVFGIEEAIPVDEDGHEVGGSDGPRPFIAMEYIDGETLHDYVKKGPLPLNEAVNIAAMITEALKAAHEKEIVHRDIKSANVMLTQEGVAKVLDFGLAKTNQSTMLTRMGSTLGTVAYMSPEQARGQEVDSRTDLYSLGTILYEMVTGELPYGGDYEQAILYGILNETPDPLTSKRTGVPMGLEWIVTKLLSKEADYRYQTAADLLADLKTVDLSGSGHSRRSMSAVTGAVSDSMLVGTTEGTIASTSSGVSKWAVGAIAVAVLLGLAAGWAFKPTPEVERSPVRRLSIALPSMAWTGFPTGSADGRYWAFSGADSSNLPKTQLWDVENNSIRSMPGTEMLFVPTFSPDGSWIAMSGNTGVSRARVPTGRALSVGPERNFIWLDSGNLIVGAEDSLRMWRISMEDQERTPIQLAEVDTLYDWFGFFHRVAETSVILLTAGRSDNDADVLAVNLDNGTVTTLIQGACCALSHGDRTLLYLTGVNVGDNRGQLVAQHFNASTIRLEGVPIDLLTEEIDVNQFGVGGDDSFYLFPPQTRGGGGRERLSWVDPESGRADVTDFPVADYDRLAFSPDGSQIAMERVATDGPNAGRNIYIFDLDSRTEQRLTYTVPVNRVPVWTSSGKIYFAGGPVQDSGIFVKNADGSGAETKLVDDGDFPTVSPDEEWLVYVRNTNLGDLIALNLQTGLEVSIDTSETRANDPAVSPNGKYIAYSIDDIGRNAVGQNQRVFVRSFPDPDRLYIQAVEDRADDPFWSLDGKYLYYRSNGELMRIEVDTRDVFRPLSAPETIIVFPAVTIRTAVNPTDGRLLIVHPGAALQASSQTRVDVILSFSRYLDELFGTDD